MLLSGSRFDRYVVEKPLGDGEGGVYQAFDPRLRRRVALAVFDADRRVVARMRAVAALSHPNVVTIYDVGESDGSAYLAMELLVGRTLRTVMDDGDVSTDHKLRWLVEIADALAAAHRAGLTHGNVKLENVMISESGAVKVLGFRIAGDGGDERADQRAWGVVAHELLSDGKHVPREIDRAIHRALEEEVSKRWPTMDALLDRLVGIAPRLGAFRKAPRTAIHPPGQSGRMSAVWMTTPATRRQETEGGEDAEPKQVERDVIPITKNATGRRRLVLGGSIVAVLGAMIAGAWSARDLRSGATSRPPGRSPESPAPPRCALREDELTALFDVRMSSYGIVATRGGALFAGTSAGLNGSGTTTFGFLAAGGGMETRTQRGSLSAGFPALADDPVLLIQSMEEGRGTFNVYPVRDALLGDVQPRAWIPSPMLAYELRAASAGGTVFAAAGGDCLSPSPHAGGGLLTDAPQCVTAFVYRPGQPIATGRLVREGDLRAVAASPLSGAALISHGTFLEVVSFDRSARVLGSVVVSGSGSESGNLFFDGERFVAVWSNGHHWETLAIGESTDRASAVPASEDAATPVIVPWHGELAAAWVKSTSLGAELRMAVARDIFDLPRSSTVLRTAPMIARPALAMSESSGWLVWQEGEGGALFNPVSCR